MRNKSVAAITSRLNKTVAELEGHAKEQLVGANLQKRAAQVAEAASEAHKREHELALKVAANIKALLS